MDIDTTVKTLYGKHLRNALIKPSILQYPDFNKQFFLVTDASLVGTGAVLSQEHKGELHPVVYASKLFNIAERAYSASEQELAVVWAVRHFNVYLQATPFILQCDQKALSFLTKATSPIARLQRWALILSGYAFDVQYVPGSKMGHADALSRIQTEQCGNKALSIRLQFREHLSNPNRIIECNVSERLAS